MLALASPGWVEAEVARAISRWQAAAGPWRTPSPQYTAAAQALREEAHDRALTEVRRIARSARRFDPAEVESRLISAFAHFAAEALDLGPAAIHLLTHDFLPIGTQLARWARRFDPKLPNAGIVQACRNAWTACGLQPLLAAPMRLTPAILAYSLLYPYTDNYLDQPSATPTQMLAFSHRFRARLAGEILTTHNRHEACVWHMVRLIESDFPRPAHPQVYASLLAIHDAQVRSLHQRDPDPIAAGELLRITCAKGGTSVLADAALVHGALTHQQAEFAFLWGVLLQLGDDLQDVHEDLARGSDTLFTRAVRATTPLDDFVAQLLNLSDDTAAKMDLLPHGDTTQKSLLRMSWRSLILMAVAQADEFFSPQFLDNLETRSPFRFAFLRSRRRKLDGSSGLFHRLFEVLLTNQGSSDSSALLGSPICHPERSSTQWSEVEGPAVASWDFEFRNGLGSRVESGAN